MTYRSISLVLWMFFAFSAAWAGDPFNTRIVGSLTVVPDASSTSYERQNQNVANNQAASAILSQVTGLARADLFYQLNIEGVKLTLTFNGDAYISGAAGAYPEAISDVQLTFTTNTPMYVTCTTDGTVQNATNSGFDAVDLENGNNNPFDFVWDTGSPHNFYQALLQPGTYIFDARVNFLGGRLTSAGAASGSLHGYLSLTPSLPPSVTTGNAVEESIFTPAVTLNGTVNPNRSATTAGFEYGTSRFTAYGGSYVNYFGWVDASPAPNDSTANQAVSAKIPNLAPGTLYHYRLTAENANGKVVGEDREFVTGTTGSAFAFSAANYTVPRKSTSAAIAVECIGGVGVGQTASVKCLVSDGTAKAGVDYDFPTDGNPVEIYFTPNGNYEFIFYVPLKYTSSSTGNKTILLTLKDPSDATLVAPSRATLTINDTGVPMPPAPAIASLAHTAGGSMHLQCVGAPNTTYLIQSASKLDDNQFATCATATADFGGTFSYNDPTVANQMFYRLVIPTADTSGTGATMKRKPTVK